MVESPVKISYSMARYYTDNSAFEVRDRHLCLLSTSPSVNIQEMCRMRTEGKYTNTNYRKEMSGGRRGEHAEAGGGRRTEWRPLAAPCRFGHAAALFFAELRGPGLAHLAVLERSSGSRARGRESQE